MKKFLGLLALIMVMSSCNKEKHTLELNLVKGEVYNQVMSSKSTVSQTMMGMDINIEMLINANISYKVLDFQNSLYDMEVRYKEMSMTMNLPTGMMEFSSLKNDSTDILSTILGLMVDKPFYIKMAKTGKITEVRNIDSLYAGVVNTFSGMDEAQSQQLLNQVQQAYGEKAFKGNLEMCTAIFPDTPVSLNTKWKVETKLESAMPANMISTYKLTQVSDSCYHISGSSVLKTDDKEAYVESNGMKMKYDLTGDMASDIKVDKATGWILSATINQNIEGYTIFKANAQMPQDMSIPMKFKNEMTYSNN